MFRVKIYARVSSDLFLSILFYFKWCPLFAESLLLVLEIPGLKNM